MKIKDITDVYLNSRPFRALAPNSQIFYQLMISTFYQYVDDKIDTNKLTEQYVDALYVAIIKHHSKHRAVSVMKIMNRGTIYNINYH